MQIIMDRWTMDDDAERAKMLKSEPQLGFLREAC